MAAVTAELSIEIGRLKAGLDAARTEIRNFKSHAQREGAQIGQAVFGGGSGVTRNMQIQNAAFQMQDFVVQVQAGQSALRAFIQQGSQFAGAFGPWGAAIGLGIALLGSLYGVLSKTGEESEEVKKAMEELQNALDGVNRSLSEMAKEEAARALADHSAAVDDIAKSWENAITNNVRYFDAVQKTADAEHALKTARLREEEQAALSGASSERAADIRREFADRRRGAQSDRDATSIQTELERARFNQGAAQRGADEIATVMTPLQNQLAELQRTRALQRPNVRSDEEALLDDYRAAMAREQAAFHKHQRDEKAAGAVTGGIGYILSSDEYGNAADKKLIEEVGKRKAELEAVVAAGRGSYDRAGLTDEEKRDVRASKVEEESQDKAIATIKKELIMLEKRLADARRTAADETKKATDLELKAATQKANASADNKEAENLERERVAKERATLGEQVRNLRESTAAGERRLMSPGEHAQALQKQMAQVFGVPVTSGGDVQSGLARLKKEAEDARARGDTAGEKSALDRLRHGQGLAGELAGLGGGAQRARVAGETASALGIILGNGGGDLVLDETKRGNQLLERIHSALQDLNRKTGDVGFGGLTDIMNM